LGFRNWFKEYRLGGLLGSLVRFLESFLQVLKIPTPDTAQMLRRIQIMEQHVVLPIKAAGIVMLLQSFPWIGAATGTLDVPVETARSLLWVYIAINIVCAGCLLAMWRLPPAVIEWMVFAVSLVDGIFLGVLTLISGGFNSAFYWLFLALIIRSSVSVPRGSSQLLLNITLSTCYLLAGFAAAYVAANLSAQERPALELYEAEYPAEPLLLRIVLLMLMTFGCYAVQVLLEHQRQAAEEAREFAVREVQLRSAGRLAAEFAHQLKNPLAIINNAVFSLQRSLKERREDPAEQIRMIREEVEHADRIITQVMGYAQLNEGHVEKLDAVQELQKAIEQAFPPAAKYPIVVHRDFARGMPPLLMQRRHAAETFLNLLQNAREALPSAGGNVWVTAHFKAGQAIEVIIVDDGPGIAPDKLARVLEAYYTTKEKGTGLGLATVKHNVELYGGTVRVESTLGKGARFTLTFPARTL